MPISTASLARLALGALIASTLPIGPPAARADDELKVPRANFPKLPKAASGVQGFVPKGWKVEAQASGDLNGDGLADLAFVLRGTDRRNVVAPRPALSKTTIDTNPRILAVAFASRAKKPLQLVLENRTLIPRHEDANLDDPFEEPELSVQDGTFSVKLRSFAASGDALIGISTLTFRHTGRRFELARYQHDSRHRMTGEIGLKVVDYASGTVRVESAENDEDETPRTVRTGNIPTAKRVGLDEVGDGLMFEPTRAGSTVVGKELPLE